jgi:PAS domain S-box-containing protein
VPEFQRTVPDVHLVVSLLPDIVHEFDLVTRQTSYVSPQAAAILGYAMPPLDGTEILVPEDAVHPDDRGRVSAHLAQLSTRLDDGEAEVEYRLRGADGAWRRARSRARVSRRDAAGRATHVLGVARDVTEVEQAVDAAREQHTRLTRRVLDSVLAFVAVLDVDGTLRDVNSTALAAVGIAADAAVGRPAWDGPWFAGLDGERGRLRAAVSEAAAGVAGRYDATLRVAGGAHLVVDLQVTPLRSDDGAIDAVVASAVDLTERRRAEAAVRESEQRLRAVIDTLDQGFCVAEIVLDGNGQPVDYRFLEVNPLFEEMTGLHDAVGRTAMELVPGLEAHWVQRYAEVALDRVTMSFEDDSPAMGRWFKVFATPVLPYGRFALIFSDITARRRSEQVIREREAAERARRERAELLADVMAALEQASGARARVQRLVDVLVANGARRVVVSSDAPGWAPVSAGDASDEEAEVGVGGRITVPLDLGTALRGNLTVVLSEALKSVRHDVMVSALNEVALRAGVLIATERVREQEHAVAARLQRALLPDRLVAHPALDVAARYQAAGDVLEVGGDWYDSWALPDGRVGLTVGDVVGHSVESAAAMGRIRTALSALAPASEGAGELLERLDEFVSGPEGADFVTTCCVLVDPVTGRLRTAAAGHPPPLVVTPSGESRWIMTGRSLPLGIGGAARPEGRDVLGPGDLLVLCSDGLVERRGRPLWEGLERLRAAVIDVRDQESAAVCAAIVDQLTAGAEVVDDIVVLCARRTPSAKPPG